MKFLTRKYWSKIMMALAPLIFSIALAIAGSGGEAATAVAYGGGNGNLYVSPLAKFGLGNQLLYVANGRASNIKIIDVGSMSVVDTIPVPRPLINAAENAGQTGNLVDKTLGGLGLTAPVHLPDMFYWEVHGVVPSKDRQHVYAVGALSMTPADDTMYEVNTNTKAVDREIPLAQKLVGYCGLEYDRNDENSQMLYAENMATGATDLATLTGLPIKPQGIPDLLGATGIVNTLTGQLPMVGGISEENIASGTNTGFINTDWNGNANSSTCGIAWNADGTHAFASQMFEPLIDKLDWNTKTTTGEILPASTPGTGYHQETSAKSRGLMLVASSSGTVDIYDMSSNVLVGGIDMNALTGVRVDVHGVEMAPGNDNILYVTARNAPSPGQAAEFVVDITNLSAPSIIGGVGGLDTSACGVYADANKQAYYQASGECKRPDMTISGAGAQWATYMDYSRRILSVSYSLAVNGNPVAANATVVNSTNTNNVQTLTAMPIKVGTVSNTHSASFIVRYSVPSGIESFRAQIAMTADDPCGNQHDYPGQSNASVPADAPQR